MIKKSDDVQKLLDEDKEKYIVVFSGGFDSTFLIHYLINTKDYEFDTLHLVSFQYDEIISDNKNKREEEARQNIIKYFSKKYTDLTFNYHKIVLSGYLDFAHSYGSNTGLSQPILWAAALYPLLLKGSKVFFGYNRDDDAVLQIDSVQKMLSAMSELQNMTDDIKVKFYFPLLRSKKENILVQLCNKHPEVFNYCTTCEGTQEEDFCGVCHTCTNLERDLMLASIFDSDHKDFYLNYLKEKFGTEFTYKLKRKQEEKAKECCIEKNTSVKNRNKR